MKKKIERIFSEDSVGSEDDTYCDVLPKSLKAGISEAAAFTRQRTRRTVTTQRTSATQLVGSFSVATKLVGKVSSIPTAKTLLKGESAERRECQIIERYRRVQLEKIQESIHQRRVSRT
jgi:hypothetical protein